MIPRTVESFVQEIGYYGFDGPLISGSIGGWETVKLYILLSATRVSRSDPCSNVHCWYVGTARITVGTVVTARITFLHVFIRSSNIRLLYILSRLFIISRVYLEPT